MVDVLLVEDDEGVRSGLRDLLEGAGRSVAAVRTAETALALFPDLHPVRLLLTDLHLPGDSGLDLIERVRLTSAQLAAILISAAVTPEVMTRAAALGNVRVVSKPFDELALLREIDTLLG